MALEPVTLTGQHVELVPLSREHHDALQDAVRDGELWRLWYTSVPAPEEMAAEIDRRLGLMAKGSMLPFTVIDRPRGRVVGMTTYMVTAQVDAGKRRPGQHRAKHDG
jgi:RimJ/RimL family protein N-acetyltransferase